MKNHGAHAAGRSLQSVATLTLIEVASCAISPTSLATESTRWASASGWVQRRLPLRAGWMQLKRDRCQQWYSLGGMGGAGRMLLQRRAVITRQQIPRNVIMPFLRILKTLSFLRRNKKILTPRLVLSFVLRTRTHTHAKRVNKVCLSRR